MWELIWLMVIMKIPILYLCWVVYWAIKAEPRSEQPVSVLVDEDGGPATWNPARRPRRPGPHGRPNRSYARTARAQVRA